MRRILLTGRNGQLGWELQRTLAPLGEVAALDHAACDLGDFDAIRDTVRGIRPDLIVNAAAYTAVDRAETEPERAQAINGDAPGILAEEAQRLGAAMVHYSTDYVFDGAKPDRYTEDDAPRPSSVYGRTKLAGERAIAQTGVPHLILRTSWVYGARGRNFLLTMLRLARERDEVKVVHDQVGAPTWSRLIAEATAQILARALDPAHGLSRDVSGVFHLSAAGETSWHGFAKMIFDETNIKTRLTAIPSSAYPVAAGRPANSRLSNEKVFRAFGLRLPGWEEGLRFCLRDMAEYESLNENRTTS